MVGVVYIFDILYIILTRRDKLFVANRNTIIGTACNSRSSRSRKMTTHAYYCIVQVIDTLNLSIFFFFFCFSLYAQYCSTSPLFRMSSCIQWWPSISRQQHSQIVCCYLFVHNIWMYKSMLFTILLRDYNILSKSKSWCWKINN